MSLVSALFPVIFLILGLVISLQFWEGDSIHGPSQVLLLVSGCIAFLPEYIQKIRQFGFSHRSTRLYILHGIAKIHESIKNVSIAIWILVLVGALIGAWSVSGILPSMIVVGLDYIHPKYFLVGACLASAIVSIASGSSWSTVGTIGIALMGVGEIWGFHSGLVAGAILSGAYFGDKLSPLSDTTNLASGITKVPLQAHIRFMIPTTFLSFGICLVVYAILGWRQDDIELEVVGIHRILESSYPFHWFRVLLPFLVLVAVAVGISAIPSLFLGVVGGCIVAMCYTEETSSSILSSLVIGYESHIGHDSLDSILSGGGILSMIPTILLILSAMLFGGCMEASGRMARIIQEILSRVQSVRALILNTMGFCLFTNLTTSDQYLSIVIPGRTLRDSYIKMNVDQRILSRALEDSGTITSVLIPWNSCGSFMSTTLGISTIVYLPFCFFHWIHILISVSMATIKAKK
jgi:NhaC family Na+:H+ antiporter